MATDGAAADLAEVALVGDVASEKATE